MKKILITGSHLVPNGVDIYLQNHGYVVLRDKNNYLHPHQLDEKLIDVSGYIIGGYEEPTAENFENANQLEVVAWPGIDFKSNVPGWRKAFDLGIAFVNSPGSNANSVAEFTIAMMLLMTRKIGFFCETGYEKKSFPVGTDLHGKTLGIIGMGNIGSRVTKIATFGFGMKVVYTSIHRHPDIEQLTGAQFYSKDKLLPRVDILSLHRPGLDCNEQPEIGEKELRLIKKNGVLINSGKCNLVDPKALLEAICNGTVSSAAFDECGVGEYWEKLRDLGKERFFRFPHIGFNTIEANEKASMSVAQAVVDVLNGDNNPLINNPEYELVRKKCTK